MADTSWWRMAEASSAKIVSLATLERAAHCTAAPATESANTGSTSVLRRT